MVVGPRSANFRLLELSKDLARRPPRIERDQESSLASPRWWLFAVTISATPI